MKNLDQGEVEREENRLLEELLKCCEVSGKGKDLQINTKSTLSDISILTTGTLLGSFTAGWLSGHAIDHFSRGNYGAAVVIGLGSTALGIYSYFIGREAIKEIYDRFGSKNV